MYQVQRARASHLPLLLGPHIWGGRRGRTKCRSRVAYRPAAWTSRVGQDAGHRTLLGGCGGSVGHVPVPVSGALVPIGVALAMATTDLAGRCNSPLARSAGSVEACEARETGQYRTGAGIQSRAERPRCAKKGVSHPGATGLMYGRPFVSIQPVLRSRRTRGDGFSWSEVVGEYGTH